MSCNLCGNLSGLLFNRGDGNLQDMQCMMATGPHSVLMGGHQTKVIEVDLNKGIEVNQVTLQGEHVSSVTEICINLCVYCLNMLKVR